MPKEEKSARVAIVVIVHNRVDVTERCIKSLLFATEFKGYRVIIFDNGGGPGIQEYLRSLKDPRIVVHRADRNLGFSKGVNSAVMYTHSDEDVVLLNNDIEVYDPLWLDKLQETAYSYDNVGLVGCRLVGMDGRLQHAGTYIYPETFWGQQIGGMQVDNGQYSRVREVDGVVFAGVFILRSTFLRVGYLNEELFAYFEDTDFCYRVRRAGLKVLCDGRVTLVHQQNATLGGNNEEFMKIFSKSRATFSRTWGEVLRGRATDKITWRSIIGLPIGYAEMSREIMLGLEEEGCEVHYKYAYGKGTPYPFDEPRVTDDYILNVIQSRKYDTTLPQVVCAQGDVLARNDGAIKIGYSMLEVDGVPAEWVRQANLMDEIWVPTRFNYDTFKNSGVCVPIQIVPLGVNPDLFNPDIRRRRNNNGRFIFLSIFEWGERKNPEMLVRAFMRAFPRNRNVVLIVKVNNRDGGIDVGRNIRAITEGRDAPEVCVVENVNIKRHELAALYRYCDCFVLPTSGEGWGMPIIEAMACGLPVISTGWGGSTEFLNERNGYPLEYSVVPAVAKCPYYEGFNWAMPSEGHLIDTMRRVYTNYGEASERGRRAAKEVERMFTWRHTTAKILERIRCLR